MGTFVDFIPEGQDTGHIGEGFKDFVHDPKPKFVPVEEVNSEQTPVEEPKKKGKK